MSSVLQKNVAPFKAGGVIAKGQAVKLSADDTVVVCSASTDRAIGVAQIASTGSGDVIEVAMPGGGGFLKAGGAIAKGDLLGIDTSGNLVKVAAQHDMIIAQSHQVAATGDIFAGFIIGPSMATQAQS